MDNDKDKLEHSPRPETTPTDLQRKRVWEGYHNSNYRMRYFSTLSGRYDKRIKMIIYGIGLCNVLIIFLVPYIPIHNYIGLFIGGLGLSSGLLVLYLVSSGVLKKSEIAITSHIAWTQAAAGYKKLDDRINANEVINDDEINRVEDITKQFTIRAIDVLKDSDKDLENDAWERTNKALGCS